MKTYKVTSLLTNAMLRIRLNDGSSIEIDPGDFRIFEEKNSGMIHSEADGECTIEEIEVPDQSVITNEVEIKNDSGNPVPVEFVAAQDVVITNSSSNPAVVEFATPQDVVVTNEIEIKNDVDNPIPVEFVTPPNVVVDNFPQDAFGKLRVSDAFTLGDYKHLYGLDPNFIDYTVNGGTIAFQANQACARLTTSSNPSSRVVHQTKFYHHYMPGKSQQILASFNFYNAVTNVTKRTGYFDDNNGIFFEQAGDGTLNIVLRSFVTGVAIDNRVPQSQWNVDRCDGSGASGLDLLINKTQLLYIDFQWLGVGRVRVGFAHNGRYITAHEFNGSNYLNTVYMSNPNLPIRCEVLNTGATSGGYMDQICTTVISEGGYVEAGIDWAASNPSLRSLAVGATLPIMAIRLKNSFKGYENRMVVRLGTVNIFSDSGNIVYSVAKLSGSANLTGGSWVDMGSDSGVQYNVSATGFANADVMENGFCASAVNGGNKSGGSPSANIPSAAKKNYIVQNYNSSNSEIYVVYATNIDSKATNVGVGMQWREIY